MGVSDGGEGWVFQAPWAPWDAAQPKPTTRQPIDQDMCKCGHAYPEHKANGCSFRETVFADIARNGPSGPQCECKKFEFRYGTDMARLEKVMKDIMALTLAKQDVTLQDIENILRPVLVGEPKPIYVDRPVPAPAEPVQKVVDRLFSVKPTLEGRASFNLDEEV